MFEMLKEGASKLKAKIGGDELDEKLVEVVSEENWQASTQQLHEIASAAYNYEKWQKINEFIWDKLKKSKSWKKILKTFNLIEFLLKNGPPSIISNFKYDLFQLRTFESYSNYVDGLDKGETIRERAKAVVALLGNEELLEEERVKAKNIREKMAGVVGGASGGYGSSSSSYGGNYGGSYGGYGGAGNYGNSKHESNESKKKAENKAYDYGNSVGAYGDYSYNKSTLDKYKDPKNEKPTSESKKEEKKPDIVADTKKPFEKIASKLSKPGEKKEKEVEEVKQAPQTAASSAPSNSGSIIDIFETSTSATTQPTSQPFSFTEAPKQSQPIQQPPQQLPPQQTQQVQQNFTPQQPQNINQQQPQFQQQFQQIQQGYPQNPYPQQQFNQQPVPNQFGYNQFGQPNQFAPTAQYPPQMGQYNQFGQPVPFNPQQNQFGYQQQPYPVPQQQFNPYAPQPSPVQTNAYNPSGGLNTGITLNAPAKKAESGSSLQNVNSTAQNVNWLSSTEKGLLDFSDFGSQLKKDSGKPATSKQQLSNNIQMDAWSW